MSRLVSPPLSDIRFLRTPLTPGEARVFDLLNKGLGEKWEIYVQPHLNGLRPDFVLINPDIGIAVIEVKDWNLDALSYRLEDGEPPSLWAEKSSGSRFRADDPVTKIVEYREEILSLYCPRLGRKLEEDPRAGATITTSVIFPYARTERVRALLEPLRLYFDLMGSFENYNTLCGSEVLTSQQVYKIIPSARMRQSMFMGPELAKDLRSWLVEPDNAAQQRAPLRLDERQRELAETTTPSGYRRLRGPAGSGKSVVLAARAAELAAKGKRVLVVAYNITLLHSLRDLAIRYPTPQRGISDNITWVHFHQWCKRTCRQAGLSGDYSRLWRDDNDAHREEVLDDALPRLTSRALDELGDSAQQYDAVLVDEGQDFSLAWWNLLRRVCRPRPLGEMLLVADETQDVYERTGAWTDDAMSGAGFVGGPWSRLGVSYRLPNSLVPFLRDYVERFLGTLRADIPHSANELDLYPLGMRWIQTTGDAAKACVTAILETPGFADPEALAMSDITLLVSSIQVGAESVRLLEEKGIKTINTFARSAAVARRQKFAFWAGDARIKATTIHSYKGWESRAIVVHVPRGRSLRDRALTYVALTRVKRHVSGSFLTVVCSATELEEYGKTWPRFDRL